MVKVSRFVRFDLQSKEYSFYAKRWLSTRNQLKLRRDDAAERVGRIVGHGDHVAIELRVEDRNRSETVGDSMGDCHSDRQRGRTVEQDHATTAQVTGLVHLVQTGDGILHDLVVLGRVTKGELEDVVGAGDVVCSHYGSPFKEVTGHNTGDVSPRLKSREVSEINIYNISTYLRNLRNL